MFYFLSTARHTIKSFLFAAFKVEITRDMLVAIFGENEIKQTYYLIILIRSIIKRINQ